MRMQIQPKVIAVWKSGLKSGASDAASLICKY